jgi:hypothetical protein
MSLTLEQAKRLHVGQRLEQTNATNADGTLKRWKVNGQVKTWKRTPGKVRIPVKHGLWEYGTISEHQLGDFQLANLPNSQQHQHTGEKTQEPAHPARPAPLQVGGRTARRRFRQDAPRKRQINSDHPPRWYNPRPHR